jgi:hypothetical protein
MPQIAIIWAIWDRSKWKAKSLLISLKWAIFFWVYL